jgi:hypothetical protein
VDILAPGYRILSAGILNPADTALYSGTGVASVHVAGVIARYIQHMDEPPLPAEVSSWHYIDITETFQTASDNNNCVSIMLKTSILIDIL